MRDRFSPTRRRGRADAVPSPPSQQRPTKRNTCWSLCVPGSTRRVLRPRAEPSAGGQGSRAANAAEAVGDVVHAFAPVDSLNRLCGYAS